MTQIEGLTTASFLIEKSLSMNTLLMRIASRVPSDGKNVKGSSTAKLNKDNPSFSIGFKGGKLA
jgi:hypothetical protein